MRAAPLFPMAAGLIVGIAADDYFRAAPSVYGFILLAVTIATLFAAARRLCGAVLVGCAAAGVGAAMHCFDARLVPDTGIQRHLQETPRIARLRGTVVAAPRVPSAPPDPFEPWQYRGDRTVFLLDADALEGLDGWIPVTGRVRVTVHEVVLDLREDEPVELFGKLYANPPPANPGGFDWATFYRRQGIVAGFTCILREAVQRLDSEPRHGDLVARLRLRVRGLLMDDLATGALDDGGLLEAMVLGHRSRLDRRLNDIFVKAGCMHYLAVSGTHVVILLSFVWGIGRLCGLSQRRCALLVAAVVVTYALVAEPRPPILRATIMTLLFCGSMLLRRARSRLNWMAAAAIVLMAFDPAAVFDVGFQLSFAAVMGVSFLTPALWNAVSAGHSLWRRLRHGPLSVGGDEGRGGAAGSAGAAAPSDLIGLAIVHRWSRAVALLAAVSTAAWLAGAPIVAFVFGRIQPWGPINSLLVFPLVYAAMILGLAKVALAPLLPTLASCVGVPLAAVDRLLVGFAERLAELPGASLPLSPPPWWLIGLYYFLLILFVWRFQPTAAIPPIRRSGPAAEAHSQRRIQSAALAGVLALVVGGTLIWQRPRPQTDRLTVTVLAVGAGTATVIHLPDGRTWLYDAGSAAPFDVGRSVIVPYLRHRNVPAIDAVYISHANLDHFSGLPTVIDEIPTGVVRINRYFTAHAPPRSAARRLLDLLEHCGHRVETAEATERVREEGGVRFEWLWPIGAEHAPASVNDASTVLRLSYAGRSILLTGDIEEHAQRALLRRGGIGADVLLLPHHGSIRPNSRAFVDAVGASLVVRSGRRAAPAERRRLTDILSGRTLFDTADGGAVEIVIDAAGLRIATFDAPWR